VRSVPPSSFADNDFRKANPRFADGNLQQNQRIIEKVAAVAKEAGATPLRWRWPGCSRTATTLPHPGHDYRRYHRLLNRMLGAKGRRQADLVTLRR
jgi:hypothetical protein